MKKKAFWIRLILSVGFILFLLSKVDLWEMGAIVVNGNPVYLLLAYGLALGDRLLMAYKWHVLIQVKGIQLPFWDAASVYLKTSFLGLFLPATIGADAMRAYAVTRENHKASDVISSIIIERLLGFLALFVFALGSIVVIVFSLQQSFFAGIWAFFWALVVLLGGLLAAIYISLNRALITRLRGWLQKRNIYLEQYRLGRKLQEIYQSYQGYRQNQRALVLFFLLSLLENLLPIWVHYCLALAFHLDVALLYFFILVPISLVLIRLPISISGIGVQEGFFVYFLGFIGVASPPALLLGVAGNIVAILSILVGGVLYAISGLRMSEAAKGTSVASQK